MGVGPVGLRLSWEELNAPALHEFRVAPWASASSPKPPCQGYVHVGKRGPIALVGNPPRVSISIERLVVVLVRQVSHGGAAWARSSSSYCYKHKCKKKKVDP